MNISASASNPGPRIDPDNPPYRQLRELLQAAFQPGTLRRFCQDDPLFRPLLDRFARNAGLLDMIDQILEFCRTQLLWEELLNGVAAHSPRQYNRFAGRMGWAQVAEPESKEGEGEGERLDTGGGAYIGGGVTVSGGGDFVGRDQIIYGDTSGLESLPGEPRTVPTITQQEALRLDAALPDQVHLGRAFDLAVAVRQKSSPLLTEDDLTRVHSGDVQIAWSEGEPYARLRLEVSAPECEIHGDDSYSFRLQPGHDSPAFYFHLTPTVLGEIGVIVRLYQEQDCLGSTRVHTVAREQIVGTVQLAITSHPFTGPNPPDDVEIYVGAGSNGNYPVTIQTPDAGDASDALELLPAADRLHRWLAELEGEQVDRQRQAEIGQVLFRALFSEPIRDRYVAAVGKARGGVRLRLWLDAPELQALPWELLFDAADDEFLALSGRALVTRYLSVPRGAPPLAVTPPLRVLVAVASPQGQPALNVEGEVTAVREALAPAEAEGLAQVETLPHARVMALRQALRDYRPHVLHFSGHGAVVPGGGALVLEDEAGDPALLSARQLRILLQRSGADVRLAVLNACLTARGEPVEAAALDAQRRALLGVGPALVRAGLGAVVAMQFSLSDTSARFFARDFYDTVARLEPVDLAVSRAREALALEAGTDSRDWATPVLFLRARDGVIFAGPRQNRQRASGEGAARDDAPPAAEPAAAGPNPFGDTGRITDPDRFFDREELLRQIFEELNKGSNLSLVGDSQVGKSSLLSMVCAMGPERLVQRPPDALVYLSLEWVDDEDDFYDALCDKLGIATCRGYKLTRALRGRRGVLCLDEIEKMGWDQFGFTVRVRSHLRGLADGPDAPLKLVIASRSPLSRLFPDSPELDSPLAGICHQLDVGPFPSQVARAFLAHRLQGSGVGFAPDKVDALLAGSGGHPARLQRAAATLFDRVCRREQ